MASQENIAEVNEALNALYVEEEDYDALRASINKCAARRMLCAVAPCGFGSVCGKNCAARHEQVVATRTQEV